MLDCCLSGERWTAALIDEVRRNAATPEGTRALFGIVIERLGDLFEPRLADLYGRLLSELIGRPELAARYDRVRQRRGAIPQVNPAKVFVLSRVTLGADVAVTSVMLDAAKRRFPRAEIYFAGARKGWELFAGDRRILHRDVPYGRAALLADRLAACPDLDEPDSIVIDPDSRLSQLGVLPVCQEQNYYFFDSRSAGGESSTAPLPELAAKWAAETFDVADPKPYIDPLPSRISPAADVTVSLGVGENPAKRLADPFERQLLHLLPANTLIDEGGSEEESRRVRESKRVEQRTFRGAFAVFAAAVRESGRFIGYDSAAGHVASVCGIPSVCIFAGAASDRMFYRWKPRGARVFRDSGAAASEILAEIAAILGPLS